MKSINPLTGINQITAGFFSYHRYVTWEFLNEKHLSPTLLGYYIIFLTLADWDKSKFRFGLIRFEISDIAMLIGKSLASVYKNLNDLEKHGLVSRQHDLYVIVGFANFTARKAQSIAKEPIPASKLLAFFPHLKKYSEILESNQIKKASCFRDSSREGLGNHFSEGLPEYLQNQRKDVLENMSTDSRNNKK